MTEIDQHFKLFASSLEAAIKLVNTPDDEDFLALQKRQVDTLVDLEKQFRLVLCKSPQGNKIYKAFIHYICEERGNILAARPYFRERQDVFAKNISNAIRQNDVKTLQKYAFNYQFVLFVLKFPWRPGSKIVKLSNKITEIRSELVTMNLPLAISRARIFYNRTPKAQLEFMDLVQISSEGLMSAIDKFKPPFSRVFRAVIVGRSVGNMISNYSETLVHFYPNDKRKIYRANKALGRNGSMSLEDLTKKVNDGVEKTVKTNPNEIADLLAAQSCVSTDSTSPSNEDSISITDRLAAPLDQQPDVIIEKNNALLGLEKALNHLTVKEIKVLKMKGISI